jgi:hypothetical protein
MLKWHVLFPAGLLHRRLQNLFVNKFWYRQQNRSIFVTNLKTPVNRERNRKRSVHTHPQNDDRSVWMWITTTLRTQMQVGVRLQRNEDQTSHASIALLASKVPLRSTPLAAASKPATGEGMDKSALVHTQIQIIIIHFLPSPFPPIPNE